MIQEICLLLYFIVADAFGIDWLQKMRPIVNKYGCIMNALRAYHLVRLYDCFFYPSIWINRLTFRVVMMWRKHIVHNF